MNIRRRHSGDWQRRLRSIVAMDQQREQDVGACSSGPSRSETHLLTDRSEISHNSRHPGRRQNLSNLYSRNYDATRRTARSVGDENGLSVTENNLDDRDNTFSNQNERLSTSNGSSSSSPSLFSMNGSQSSQNNNINEFHPALEGKIICIILKK